MFAVMRSRLLVSAEAQSKSLEDLADCETQSIDSAGNSDVASSSSEVSGYSTNSGISFFDKIGLRRRHSSESASILSGEDSLKQQVVHVLRFIKQMNAHTSPKMEMVAFLELLQMHYTHVSLALLQTFMERHRMLPRASYFHYYIYFLHYAEFYHHTRSAVDVIDLARIEFHRTHLAHICQCLKYVYRIITRKTAPDPVTEVTL